MNERALIVGAGGFVGRNMVDCLVRHELCVHACDLDEIHGVSGDDVTVHVGDVTDASAMQSLVSSVRPAYVFYLASAPRDAAFTELIITSVVGLESVFSAVVSMDDPARTVVIGSAAEYGSCEDLRQLKEDESLRPRSPYGLSKALGHACFELCFRTLQFPVTYARTFNLVGAGLPEGLVPRDIAERILAMGSAPKGAAFAVSRADSVRDFVDVRDACDAFFDVCRLGAPGRTYNVCSGKPTTVLSLAELIAEHVSTTVVPHPASGDESPPDMSLGDPSRTREEIGWTATTALGDSVAALAMSLGRGDQRDAAR